MAFTYVLSTNRGKVRFLIPDNDADSYELEDAEIDYFLTVRGSHVKAAAVDACRWLARKYAQQPTYTADGVTYNGSRRAAVFAARADELAAEMSAGIRSVDFDRVDGYSEVADDGEYPTSTVYVKTR